MALKQQISVPLTLLGDGSSTAFAYAISNLYQSANGYALPFGSAGVVPSSVTVTGSSEPVTSATVDANGNITITFTTAPANGELVTLQLNIIWNSGAAVSSSPTQTSLVTLSGASTVGITGTVAVTQSTSPWVVSNGGTFAVQAAQSGTWNIGTVTAATAITTSLPAGANTIGAVTQASGPWTINETQLNSVALGSPSNYGTSPGAVSVQGVNAFITNTVPVTLTSTTITGTVAVTQSTSPWVVSNCGTFAVQATQTTSPWVVGGPAASGSATSGNPVLQGAVFNTTQPTVTNGQVVDLQSTARGALIIASGVDPLNVSVASSGTTNTALASWTNATALNTTALPYTNTLTYSTVQIILNQVGTFSGGIVTFEASLDNTNWYAINGSNTVGTVSTNITLTSNTLSQFTFATTGLPYFRLRLSQVINGTGTLTVQSSVNTSTNVQNVTVSGSLGINYMPGTGLDNTSVPGSTLWVGGVYNSSPETYTTGDMASFQMDVNGNLLVKVNVALPAGTNIIGALVANQSVNLTQLNSVALGSPSNYGTSPGAIAVQGVNAFITNTVPVTLTSTTVTGTVAVTQSTSPWVVNMSQWGGTALGTPTNFGTTPGAVVVGAANVSLFQGTAVISATNPTFASITDGTNKAAVLATILALKTDQSSLAGTALGTPTNFGTTPGAVISASVNASLFVGTTVAVAASAGVQKVGISGAAGATMDAVITAATAPANALAILSVNNTTAPSLTTGQSVALQSDYQGSIFIKPYRRGQTVSKATTCTTTAATTILAAQAAGIFADISTIVITVTGAAAAAFTVTLSDGTNSYIYDMTTGTATSTGTQVNITFNPPLPAASAATAWTLAMSAANTVHVTLVAVLQKAS